MRNTSPRAGNRSRCAPAGAALSLGLGLGLVAGAARAADPDLACDASHPRIEVTVDGLRSDKGDVVVELYPDDAKGFLKSRARLGRNRARAGPAARVCIPAPAPGVYALVAYHDEDGDRHLSKNFIGLPSEGFGVSNNPPPALGKPSFRAVRFQVGEGETLMRVRIHYGLGGASDARR